MNAIDWRTGVTHSYQLAEMLANSGEFWTTWIEVSSTAYNNGKNTIALSFATRVEAVEAAAAYLADVRPYVYSVTVWRRTSTERCADRVKITRGKTDKLASMIDRTRAM